MSSKPRSRSSPRQQQSFELERFVPYLMTQIYHRLNKSFARSLRPLHLNPAQWRVLANLARRDPRTFTELLQLTALDQPTLSRTVARLVRNGHVTRQRKPSDGRAAELRLTDAGRRMWTRALTIGLDQYRLATRGIARPERERLAAVLTEMLENVRAMPEPEASTARSGAGRRA